jgi:MtN3 and saliva related transmembrane protein
VGVEAVGWASSVVLLATILKQLHKQWEEGSSEGVSKWLFIGQSAASIGFTIYSWLVGNWVFVVTNALLFCSALVGLAIVRYHRRHESKKAADDADAADPRRSATSASSAAS